MRDEPEKYERFRNEAVIEELCARVHCSNFNEPFANHFYVVLKEALPSNALYIHTRHALALQGRSPIAGLCVLLRRGVDHVQSAEKDEDAAYFFEDSRTFGLFVPV